MNIRILAAALAALSMSGAALAQDHGRDHDRRDDRVERRGPPQRQGRPSHVDERHEGRGAGPDHNFYRGGRLPPQYRDRQYVVDDWRGHRLSAPPRGYHWVQAGNDYVLAAIATGVITSILLDR